jgi:hypothetical protein
MSLVSLESETEKSTGYTQLSAGLSAGAPAENFMRSIGLGDITGVQRWVSRGNLPGTVTFRDGGECTRLAQVLPFRRSYASESPVTWQRTLFRGFAFAIEHTFPLNQA